MLQAPFIDSVLFDPFSSFQDCFCSAKVSISRCYVIEALMISVVIVIIDEHFNLRFQITG